MITKVYNILRRMLSIFSVDDTKIDAILNKVSKIQTLVFSQYKPRNFKVIFISEREENMTSFMTYKVELLPVPVNTDVVEQKLEVVVNSDPREAVSLSKEATEYTFEVEQDSVFKLNLWYVDDAGNDSAVVSTEELVAVDTFAPAAPIGFGNIVLLSERVEETQE